MYISNYFIFMLIYLFKDKENNKIVCNISYLTLFLSYGSFIVLERQLFFLIIVIIYFLTNYHFRLKDLRIRYSFNTKRFCSFSTDKSCTTDVFNKKEIILHTTLNKSVRKRKQICMT